MPLWLSSLISALAVPVAFSLIRGDTLGLDAFTGIRVLAFWMIFAFAAQICVSEGSNSGPGWPAALLTLLSAKGGERLGSDMELVGRVVTFFGVYYMLLVFVFSSLKPAPQKEQ